MKERALLLCMTYPTPSEKYGSTVCMAGITEAGEFRRIFPVPFSVFRKRYDRFHKRYFLDYEVRGPGDDGRKESIKIVPESIKVSEESIDYYGVREICREHATSIEELEKAWKKDRTSLGIVKPALISFHMKLSDERERTAQMTIDGGIMPEMLAYSFYYRFKCLKNCVRVHRCICLDSEIGQLYRRMKKGNTEKQIGEKMKAKLFDWMKLRDLYFMMGTHRFHPNHWMIISLLYPKKVTTLSDFCVHGVKV